MQPTRSFDLPDLKEYNTWTNQIDATYKIMQTSTCHSVPDHSDIIIMAEIALITHAQSESFPGEFQALISVSSNSHLLLLSPEFDKTLGVIRVRGRLGQSENLEPDTIHRIVLNPNHPLT